MLFILMDIWYNYL